MYTPLERQQLIQQRLQVLSPAMLTIEDESHLHLGHAGAKSGASHFAITLISSAFEGLPLLKRHQLVYAALKDLIPQEIHALKIRAQAPTDIVN